MLTVLAVFACSLPVFAEETEKPEEPIDPEPYVVGVESFDRTITAGYTNHGYQFPITVRLTGTRYYNSSNNRTLYYEGVVFHGAGINDSSAGESAYATVSNSYSTNTVYSGSTVRVYFTVSYDYGYSGGSGSATQYLSCSLN